MDVAELGLAVSADGAMRTLENYTKKLDAAGMAGDALTSKTKALNSGFTENARQAKSAHDQLDRLKSGTAALADATARVNAGIAGIHGPIQRGTVAYREMVSEIARLERATNLAASETRRQQVVEIAAAETRKRTAAQEEREASQAEARTRRMTLLHLDAIRIDEQKAAASGKAADVITNRLRPGFTALASSIVQTNGPATQLLSTIGMFGVGSGPVIAALAGMAAIAKAHSILTKETREQTQAQDDALASLKRWNAEQNAGPAGSFGTDVSNSRDALRAQIAERDRLRRELDQGQVGRNSASDEFAGFGSSTAIEAERLRALEKRYDEAVRLVEKGERRVQEIERQAAGESLAFLVRNNQATAAQRAQAFIQLKADQDALATLSRSADQVFKESDQSIAQRRALIDQIKELNDALNPVDKTADRAAKASEKLTGQFEKQHGTLTLALERQRALNAVAGESEGVLDRVNAALDLKAKLAEIDAQFTGKQADALKGLATQLHVVNEATREEAASAAHARKFYEDWLAKKQEAGRLAREAADKESAAQKKIGDGFRSHAQALLDAQPKIHTIVSDTVTWGDALHSVFGVVGSINREFGETSRRIEQIARGAQSITAQSGTSSGKSGGASTLQQGGDIAALVYTVGKGLWNFGTWVGESLANTKAKERAEEFRAAMRSFDGTLADWVSNTRGATMNAQAAARSQLAAQTGGFVRDAAITSGYTGNSGGPTSAAAVEQRADRVRALIPDAARRGDRQEFERLIEFSIALDKVAVSARQAEEALQRQQERERADFQSSNDILAARLAGNSALADALQTHIDIEAKYRAEVARFGETAETARYHVLLLADAEKKRIEVAATEQRRVDRSVADSGHRTLAYFDPRGASDAMFVEEWRRKIEDATTPIEKLALASEQAAASLDRLAERALKDATETGSAIARILTANGNARGAEDVTRLGSQVNELDAMRRGSSSDFNILLTQRAQYLENSALQMQRAIEDRTRIETELADTRIRDIDAKITAERTRASEYLKVLDGRIADERTLNEAYNASRQTEIDAIRETATLRQAAVEKQLSSAQEAYQASQTQIDLIRQEVDARRQAVESLSSFADSLKLSDLSTLSPIDQRTEALRQLESVNALARGGDSNAAAGFGSAANTFLQSSRPVFASGVGYANDFATVQSMLEGLRGQYGAQLDRGTARLGAAESAAEAQRGLIEGLHAQRDAFQLGASAQIEAIEKARNTANTISKELIDQWSKERDTVNASTSALLEAFDRDKLAVTNALADTIKSITSAERAAYEERARYTDWMVRLQGDQTRAAEALVNLANYYTGTTGRSEFTGLASVPITASSQYSGPSAAESQIISTLQEQTRVLTQQLAAANEQNRLTAVAVTQQGVQIQALVVALNNSVAQIDQAGRTIKEEIRDTTWRHNNAT